MKDRNTLYKNAEALQVSRISADLTLSVGIHPSMMLGGAASIFSRLTKLQDWSRINTAILLQSYGRHRNGYKII